MPINPTRDASGSASIADAIHERRWWTLGVLCLTLVLICIDNTILNVAIPTLAREFDAPRASCSGSSTATCSFSLDSC